MIPTKAVGYLSKFTCVKFLLKMNVKLRNFNQIVFFFNSDLFKMINFDLFNLV
jgi:hypothetical protein